MAFSTVLSALGLAFCLAVVQCQDFNDRDQTVEECRDKVMDIYFILDSSSSIWVNDVEREREFVRDVVSRLDINSRATRVGILTFSDDIQRPVLGLNNFQSKGGVLDSINIQNLPHRTGITNTHLAIRHVRSEEDFRQDITKVMVVITDGGSRSPGSTAREAELAKEEGFYFFVVGVGQYLDEREWRTIATDPDDDFIYNITNFRYLPNVRSSLASRACLLPPIITNACRVEQLADMYFVAQSTVDFVQVESMENFLDRTDGRGLLQTSFFMDGCNDAVNIMREDFDTFCNRFDTVDIPSEFSDILAEVRSQARLVRSRGEDRKQVAVVYLDENDMRDFYSWRTEMSGLSNDGVELVVVDMGIRSYRANLQRLVDPENIIRYSPGYDQELDRDLLQITCDSLNEEYIIDAPPPQ